MFVDKDVQLWLVQAAESIPSRLGYAEMFNRFHMLNASFQIIFNLYHLNRDTVPP